MLFSFTLNPSFIDMAFQVKHLMTGHVLDGGLFIKIDSSRLFYLLFSCLFFIPYEHINCRDGGGVSLSVPRSIFLPSFHLLLSFYSCSIFSFLCSFLLLSYLSSGASCRLGIGWNRFSYNK